MPFQCNDVIMSLGINRFENKFLVFYLSTAIFDLSILCHLEEPKAMFTDYMFIDCRTIVIHLI